jgi:tetratricopeptide (TPR) repeat protein
MTCRADRGLPLAFLLCAVALPARADNPADQRNTRLAAEAARLGSSARGVLPLLELWSRWEQTSPAKTLALLDGLARDRRVAPARRILIDTLRAQAQLRMGNPDASARRVSDLGYLTRWRVIGPFDNEGKTGFDRATAPEERPLEAPDLQARYPGRERPVQWRELPAEIVRDGYVSFGALLRPAENACALAETFVHSARTQPLSLWIGAGGAHKVYWNGEEVLRDAGYRRPSPDRAVVMVAARGGRNRLLVKVCVTDSTWGFQLRLGDANGGVASGLRHEATPADGFDLAPATTPPPLPAAPLAPLAELERAAAREPARADELADLARYLSYTGSDDPAERRAKQLAQRAAELEPTVRHLLLAAQLAEERAEVMRFTDRALALAPNDPEAMLMAARVAMGGPQPEAALPRLEAIGTDTEWWTAAALLQAQILRDLGLAATARTRVEEAARRVGETSGILRALAEVRQAAGDPDASLAARKQLLDFRFDDFDARRVLITDALQRGAHAEVLDHVDVFQELAPGSERSLLYLAEVYDALARDDLVLATYRRAMALVPESASVHAAYGQALLRADRPDLAADAFASALALKPQDAATRELLEQIQPRPRHDEAYATPSARILDRRRVSGEYSATVLHDLTVNTVFENGLGSSFRQRAIQVHDEEGARTRRTLSLQYDPDTQRVDLRLARVYRRDGRTLESVRTFEQALGEPWYRVYYDTRELIIVFPDLEPGDVVEARWRVDDVAHRNLFADYYGDLHAWQDYVPVQHAEYVLVRPASRALHTRPPVLAGLTHTQREREGQRIDHWTANDIPALVLEDAMPGITETSPYLHVSSYATWAEVGRWYWGLIKDQLYADAALRETVGDLVRGASTTRAKVERIHRWVVRHTRYVALEFGIHGFLPYRVPLVVQRGFGDCKDKASLLYTMFREAGIDARIVLVRTRRNGAIAEAPASLAVFDHAIAYVPELDLYLDGTAEHSGTTELPTQDQGVTVLLVGPDGAELRKTPVLDAGNNRRTRELDIELAGDGSATLAGREEIAGEDAAGYREHYEAPGTRAERFERALAEIYPGLELRTQEFESLDELESPVRLRYRIRVPRLADHEGDGLRLAPTTLQDLLRAMAPVPTRVHALDLEGNRTYVEHRTVRLPPGMEATLPPGGEIANAFGRIALRFEGGPGRVGARTEFVLTRDRIAAAEYPAFRQWMEAAEQLLKQPITIRKVRR